MQLWRISQPPRIIEHVRTGVIFGAMASVKPRTISRVCVRSGEDSESQYHSRAVAKALEILELLGAAGKPLGLNDLAQKLKLSKPSTFRLLFTLEETGYVDKDQEGRYTLKHEIRPESPGETARRIASGCFTSSSETHARVPRNYRSCCTLR